MSDRTCFLAQFSDRPCDGQLIRAHLIPRQAIKLQIASMAREQGKPAGLAVAVLKPLIDAAIADPRSWVPACGGPMGNAGHHGQMDSSRTLKIPRHALPDGLEEFAAELGLEWYLDREFGPVRNAA